MLVRLSLLLASMMVVASSELRDARVASPAGGLLVVANQKEHTLVVVDPENRRELAKISVGVNGHEVIVSQDGRFAYVPIYGNAGVGRPGTDGSTIDVIDLQARKLAATIDLGKPLRPHLANAVGVIDPSTRKLVAEIPTGEPQSHMLVLSLDGHRGYTANVSAGSVSVLDLVKRNLLATIPVAKSVQRISISPDGLRIFTHDQDAPRIAVIATATNKITNWIELPDVAYASAPTPDGRWLLAVSLGANRLHVVDLRTLKVVRSLEVPERSSEILIRPGGEIAYVSGTGAGKIAVLDLRSWIMQPPIDLTPGVDGLAWVPASH